VLEEQDNTGTPKASYVYGRYIDEPIQMKRDGDTVYYHSDDLYNVTTLTNADGDVVERYRYDDFGAPHVYSPTGDPRTASSVGNPSLFTGRAYDTDLQLYDYRSRHLHPGLGRFTTRDRIGLWGDPMSMGNPYSYVGNNPVGSFDPFGLQGERWGERNYVTESTAVFNSYIINGGTELWHGTQSVISRPDNAFEALCVLACNLCRHPILTTSDLGSAFYDQFESPETSGTAVFGATTTVISGVELASTAANVVRFTAATTTVVDVVDVTNFGAGTDAAVIGGKAGRGFGGNAVVDRIATEAQWAFDQADRVLISGGTGGTKWGAIYQCEVGSGGSLEMLARRNALHQITTEQLVRNSYVREARSSGYEVFFNRGSLLDVRNAKGNLVRPDIQIMTPLGKYGIIDLSTAGSAGKIGKYGSQSQAPWLISVEKQ